MSEDKETIKPEGEKEDKRGRKSNADKEAEAKQKDLEKRMLPVVKKLTRGLHFVSLMGLNYAAKGYGVQVDIAQITDDEMETLDEAALACVQKYFPQLINEPLVLYAGCLTVIAQTHLVALPQKEEKQEETTADASS